MRIAIIGGIGSGKSETLRAARELGIACLSADEINAGLLEKAEYIQKLAELFPDAVKDGIADKATLAAEVFSDADKRRRLNELAHPEILKRIESDDSDPLVVEMPLIVESGAADYFDEIVLVSAPLRKRLKRLKDRNVSFSRAIRVIKAQVAERELKKLATRIILNDGSLSELKEAAKQLFGILL